MNRPRVSIIPHDIENVKGTNIFTMLEVDLMLYICIPSYCFRFFTKKNNVSDLLFLPLEETVLPKCSQLFYENNNCSCQRLVFPPFPAENVYTTI